MPLSVGPAYGVACPLTGERPTPGLRIPPGAGMPRAATSDNPGGLVLYLHPTLRNADLTLRHDELLRPSPLGPAWLGDLTDRFAAAGWWRPLVRHDPAERWYTRLLRSDSVEVWLLGWSPGQAVLAHDHGGAAGAFTVVDGELAEETPDPTGSTSTLRAGSRTWFGADHVQVVGNYGRRPATSVHAYSPPGLPLRFHGPGSHRGGALQAAGAVR